MKIVLLDSSEFLTPTNQNEGLFTLDQAKILKKKYKVDILSPGIYSKKDFFLKNNINPMRLLMELRFIESIKKI